MKRMAAVVAAAVVLGIGQNTHSAEPSCWAKDTKIQVRNGKSASLQKIAAAVKTSGKRIKNKQKNDQQLRDMEDKINKIRVELVEAKKRIFLDPSGDSGEGQRMANLRGEGSRLGRERSKRLEAIRAAYLPSILFYSFNSNNHKLTTTISRKPIPRTVKKMYCITFADGASVTGAGRLLKINDAVGYPQKIEVKELKAGDKVLQLTEKDPVRLKQIPIVNVKKIYRIRPYTSKWIKSPLVIVGESSWPKEDIEAMKQAGFVALPGFSIRGGTLLENGVILY